MVPTRRYELEEHQWNKIKDLLPGRKGTVGVTAQDNRRFVNAVCWIMGSGSPWRDMPKYYGDWKNIHRRFSRWSKKGVWKKIFSELSKGSKNKYLSIDSTIVRAHQHASGAVKKREERGSKIRKESRWIKHKGAFGM